MRFTSYVDALTWLESHVDFERVAPNRQAVPTLQPVRDTLALFADPQRDYPSVHITGTNGKGTTSTLTSALLAATGLRVGTFTSPDLHAINERIAVNGEPIDDEALVGPARAPGRRRIGQRRRPDEVRTADRRRRCCTSPTRASTSRSSRWAWAARGTRPTSSTATSPC